MSGIILRRVDLISSREGRFSTLGDELDMDSPFDVKDVFLNAN
jgi:hypothetical protein